MDAARVGSTLRRLRLRASLRQIDVARRAAVSQALVSSIECGRIGGVSVATLERVFAAVGASVDLDVRWRGPALERLVDARHAALVEAAVARLTVTGWTVEVEVSYSIYGERGSIDVLAGLPDRRVALVLEVKSDLVRIDDTIRKLDEKARLVRSDIALDRFGWRPVEVARLLILPDADRTRRQVRAHGVTLGAAFPGRGSHVRAWLRDPVGPLGGLLFVADSSRGSTNGTRIGLQRVRVDSRGARAGLARRTCREHQWG